MSTSQLKKRTAELRAYLGKDKHGIELLEAVCRITNELRATSNERLERATKAEQLLSLVSKDRDEMAERCRKLQIESANAKDKEQQAQSQSKIASAKLSQLLDKPKETGTPIANFTPGNFDTLVNSLRHRFGDRLPSPVRTLEFRHGAVLMPQMEFECEDLLPEFSDEAFSAFGRYILAHFFIFAHGSIRIVLPFDCKDLRKKCGSQEEWDRRGIKMMRLFGNSVKFTDSVVDSLNKRRAGFVAETNTHHW
jgi:hypothetical protein